jgi:membrane-associated HD superfamily phosphohydrolase
VGKLTKPEFFSENTHLRDNPHDDLTPNMSALVILSHIKDGVGLASVSVCPAHRRRHPAASWHGIGLVFYRWPASGRRPKPATDPAEREGFSKKTSATKAPPQSPEMAILSLADAVEAASGHVKNPHPSDRKPGPGILSSKLADGQLDECNLTFSQLTAIRKSLIFSLTNMLHGRIAYVQNENKPGQPTVKADDTSSGAAPSRSVDNG